MSLSRRSFNRTVAAATAALMMPSPSDAHAADRPTWLLFTKSSGYEHDVIKRSGDAASFVGAQLKPLFEARGLATVESKDGTLFEPDRVKRFAGFVFYTSGDLCERGTDGHTPMTPAGKQALLDAIAGGVPFVGLHCATDSFHLPKGTPDEAAPDPYTAMIGGEFAGHGEQQPGTARIVDPNFPGVGEPDDWSFTEEWYTFKRLAKDIHPIHLLETAGLKGDMYQQPPFPLTWTRTHGKGRVFYTGLGHREDVIASKPFLNLLGGAIDWCGAK